MVFAVFIVNRKQPLDEESEILYFFFFRSKRLKKDSLLVLSIHFFIFLHLVHVHAETDARSISVFA